MTAVALKQSPATSIPKGGFEATDAMNCFQVREKLDAIFDGNSPLEETRRCHQTDFIRASGKLRGAAAARST